jgi:hypothetical protein
VIFTAPHEHQTEHKMRPQKICQRCWEGFIADEDCGEQYEDAGGGVSNPIPAAVCAFLKHVQRPAQYVRLGVVVPTKQRTCTTQHRPPQSIFTVGFTAMMRVASFQSGFKRQSPLGLPGKSSRMRSRSHSNMSMPMHSSSGRFPSTKASRGTSTNSTSLKEYCPQSS